VLTIGDTDVQAVLKILRSDEWARFQKDGRFDGAPIDRSDGYIHLSSPGQVADTALKHFTQETDLTLVAFDVGGLGDALRWEVSRGGERFPHFYGLLEMSHLSWAEPMPLGPDGVHLLPERSK